jgi:hypothetical protein
VGGRLRRGEHGTKIADGGLDEAVHEIDESFCKASHGKIWMSEFAGGMLVRWKEKWVSTRPVSFQIEDNELWEAGSLENSGEESLAPAKVSRRFQVCEHYKPVEFWITVFILMDYSFIISYPWASPTGC